MAARSRSRLDHSLDAGDGARLLVAAMAATARLEAHVDEVDALNVFPVPDGDTGTNMLATMRAALAHAAGPGLGDRSLAAVCAALSTGALMGARGNSGVILSQVLRGMAEAADQSHPITGAVLAAAFRRGSEAAYAAMGQPVEGTILTVARDAARAASERAATDTTLGGVLRAAVLAARDSVARTPDLLPVLRDAGVVDAGGHGLFLLLDGALASLRGDGTTAQKEMVARPRLAALSARADEGYGFETTFVLVAAGRPLSVGAVRRRLEAVGESVVVAGDERMLRVHVHNDDPSGVIAYGRSVGDVQQVAIEDLDQQARSVCQARKDDEPLDAPPHGRSTAPAGSPGAFRGLVAIATGAGLARVLRACGAVVVERRKGRPSAGAIATAIRATGAAEVLVLANDADALLAAGQAGQFVPGVRVTVVPTRNAAEGVAALLAHDPRRPASEAVGRMHAAASSLRTIAVTRASRDSSIDGGRVLRGQVIALDAERKLLAVGADVLSTTTDAVARLGEGFELLTVYVGSGVGSDEAGRLRHAIHDARPDVEVEIVDGGQANYRYLIAAE